MSADLGSALEDEAILQLGEQGSVHQQTAVYGLPQGSDSGGGGPGPAKAVEQRERPQEGHHRTCQSGVHRLVVDVAVAAFGDLPDKSCVTLRPFWTFTNQYSVVTFANQYYCGAFTNQHCCDVHEPVLL